MNQMFYHYRVNVTVIFCLFFRSTFFAFSPLASNWFHAASMSSRFAAAYAFGSHGNIDGSTTSFGIWDGRWVWEKISLIGRGVGSDCLK